MSNVATYPLRLPRSLRAAIERVAKRDGTSINQFVTMAAAEKLAAGHAGILLQPGRTCRPGGL